MSDPVVKKLTWDNIDDYCSDIANKVKKINNLIYEPPHMIISIGRGGMIPARILSDKLGLNDVHLFGIKLYKDIGNKMEDPVIDNFDVCVKGKNVLLIDDLIDSGDTMRFLYKEIRSRGAKRIVTAALLKKDLDNSYEVDYFSKMFSKEHWIVFPWELHEFKVVEKETKVCLA